MTNILQHYRTYVSGNEAPESFHIWCALVAISSVTSRKVWVDVGYFNVFPNLYVVLVGPPGTRKTTAMSTCKKLLRAVGDVPFSAEATTKEALIREMAANQKAFEFQGDKIPYAPMTICVTELSQFLAASQGNMVDFLTTIWDQDFFDYKTKHKVGEKNVDTILGPTLNILACTTPSWITTYLKTDIISGGFSRRAVFVYEMHHGKRVAFPTVTTEMKDSWNEVVAYCRKLKNVRGRFVWEDEASAYYRHWYEHELVIPDDPLVAGYYESKQVLVLKVAMLFALAEAPQLTLSKRHLEMALDLLEMTEKNLKKVFSGVGRNELKAAAATILEIITNAEVRHKDTRYKGAMADKTLRAATYSLVNSDEYDKVMKHLVETDQLISAVMKFSGGGDRKYYLFPETKKQIEKDLKL